MTAAEILSPARMPLAVGHRWEVEGQHGAIVFENWGPRLVAFDEYDRPTELTDEDTSPLTQAVDGDDEEFLYELLGGIYRRVLAGGAR